MEDKRQIIRKLDVEMQREEERNGKNLSKDRTLQKHVEDILTQIAAKEDRFNCVVQGLQLMRDELIDAVTRISKKNVREG